MRMLRITYPQLLEGQRVAADRVMATIKSLHEVEPLPERHLVSSASGGGSTGARVGSIAWHFQRLEEQGVLAKRNRRHFFVGSPPSMAVTS